MNHMKLMCGIQFSLVLALSSMAHAKVDLRQNLSSVEEGSYLELDRPLFVPKGTTAIMMGRKRGHQALSKVGGTTCEIDLVKATGVDIFKQNLLLRPGTKLYLKRAGGETALVEETAHLRLPVVCRQSVVISKKKTAQVTVSKITIMDFARSFSHVGTLCLVDSRKTARN